MHVVRVRAAVPGPMEKLMKIGPLDAQPASVAIAPDRKAAPATYTNAAAQPSLPIDDSAQLNATSADPSFDAEKVNRIAGAVRDGSFHVDAEKIADKLITNAQDLLKRYSPN